MNFSVVNKNENANILIENTRNINGIIYTDVSLNFETETIPTSFRVNFSIDAIDFYSVWSPKISGQNMRHLGPNWSKRKTESRLASGMPVHSIVSLSGNNRATIAVSDAKTPISIATGIREETAAADCTVEFFTQPTAALKDYTATIRIDMRDIPFYDSIYDTVSWWETDCGYHSAYIPEHARLPMNSLWYSFHQELDPDEIVRQCELSKPLGMDTVIVDDGWQTDDNNRGYAYCGDWELATSKIPDMREFVERIHNTGMKVMLWYSVPYLGIYSKKYDEFKDKLLDYDVRYKHFALDPRYKEVREYLVGIYTEAVKNWGLDGLKLDFIDAFRLTAESIKPDPRRDYTSLEDAIDVLMKEITDSLYKINPEILIEFRQSYVGPTIRKYGNMLRAADCPNDALRNKISVVDLRLTSGKTPVHSDMLMWNYEDTVESAALQMADILFSVPQISVRIDKLSDSHYKMLKFYLDFWKKNQNVLLDGKLTASTPESFYGKVSAKLGEEEIVALYSDTSVKMNAQKTTVVNASHADTIYFDGFEGKSYEIVNCMGEIVEKGILENLFVLNIPTSGMVFIK